ncbi:MAG: HD domain-containing protein [Flavobacteriaceae bacterium]|nr:HD domain-containing protein [Flavobacteriaceae bacterium]
MEEKDIIARTKAFVKLQLKDAEGGHDWFHIERVYNNAVRISEEEPVNGLVVRLAALLHDIADPKFHGGDEKLGPKIAGDFLRSLAVETELSDHIVAIIANMSFKNSLDPGTTFSSKEMEVVQDADRLDAIGAIGIARAFNYGGFKNRAMYDPDIAPVLNMTKAEYKKSTAPTINHFYEKLLLLKERMHTATARKLADARHQYMLGYLEQFYAEWKGDR